jgi:hypothetical protein
VTYFLIPGHRDEDPTLGKKEVTDPWFQFPAIARRKIAFVVDIHSDFTPCRLMVLSPVIFYNLG